MSKILFLGVFSGSISIGREIGVHRERGRRGRLRPQRRAGQKLETFGAEFVVLNLY